MVLKIPGRGIKYVINFIIPINLPINERCYLQVEEDSAKTQFLLDFNNFSRG